MIHEGLCVGDGVWVDGVLIEAGRPLGTVWVPMTPGLTVFYGRNGAGKSRLLTAIAAALRGIESSDARVSAHLSFRGPFEYFSTDLLEEFGGLLWVDIPSSDEAEGQRLDCPWPCQSPRWWPGKVLAVVSR